MLWRYQPLDLEAVLSSEIHASGPFRGFRVNGSRKYCIRSSTMATHVLDQIPIINSRTNGDSAAFLVSTAAVRAEEKQQRRQVDVILMKSKRSNPAKRTTVTLSRTSGSNAVTLIFILTAALALLLVSVQLQQCRQRLLRKTSGETAGSTKRRLAEGGHEDNCVRLAPASTKCPKGACRFHKEQNSVPTRRRLLTPPTLGIYSLSTSQTIFFQ
ncbi:Toxoplasma gondii family B protein [Toxoplasma gondii ME49]|uniref:Toxoplasma gondii family B protein n=9 Tax=Toxoplasma gondii TaxID=5811 RepID=S7VNV8_TOXGG|nr:Toxoplasma gondii family B protein [Toxoplasma gondii ME49]EPR56899.1 Toxoplasma gondii family B protein [Toxoplasma gondii GT1]KAF4643988.1 Toxoplasma gondii family B protein [Toxoplasma gondii]KFG29318.1 Toxoplasma gondii family B protein [Toxoplasma gondii GAB2-2007-GAL-DOM2]KFG99328.1 Toxoplasma gondii family B protein [Toxoplasma gondii VAND]KYF39024.1 Toxoplasma gondii family B protein [Toxoplasma gondii ARI]PIM00398.1 Toxoplasma gondii family B protein [Toxoplasma gondii COUG]|eukprot:XP_018637759.1 Toxoplasma gondii family B protein [Toxoplasma gondii ME49]